MSWATNSVKDASDQLTFAVKTRCMGKRLPAGVEIIRTPVALMFVRGDRAEPGATLAKQVVSSFGYWNDESANYLDLVFFGWWKEGDRVGFQSANNSKIFRDCYKQVGKISKWRYSGETDVLLVDFEMPVNKAGGLEEGAFSFRNSMYLPVEEMIDDGRTRSLDSLVNELIAAARDIYQQQPLEVSAFDVSDRIGWTRGRKAVWERLRKLFWGEDLNHVYHELRPFAVCDLSI